MPIPVPAIKWDPINKAIQANEVVIVVALVAVAWFQYQMAVELRGISDTHVEINERVGAIERDMQDPILRVGNNSVEIKALREDLVELMEANNENFLVTSRQISMLAEQIALQPLLVERDTKRVTLNGLQRDIQKLRDQKSSVPESFLQQVEEITHRINDLDGEINRIKSSSTFRANGANHATQGL